MLRTSPIQSECSAGVNGRAPARLILVLTQHLASFQIDQMYAGASDALERLIGVVPSAASSADHPARFGRCLGNRETSSPSGNGSIIIVPNEKGVFSNRRKTRRLTCLIKSPSQISKTTLRHNISNDQASWPADNRYNSRSSQFAGMYICNQPLSYKPERYSPISWLGKLPLRSFPGNALYPS